nr:MAG TPA: hypothetical protein [Caudoviricetes sp.]
MAVPIFFTSRVYIHIERYLARKRKPFLSGSVNAANFAPDVRTRQPKQN